MDTAIPEAVIERCTKPRCTNPSTGFECGCLLCGKQYRCCESHGGEAAARRSLRSHSGLYHAKESA